MSSTAAGAHLGNSMEQLLPQQPGFPDSHIMHCCVTRMPGFMLIHWEN
jgi:hypothetical protein